MKGPRECNDPPGYQSREALRGKQQRPTGRFGDVTERLTYEEQQEIKIVIVGSPDTVTRKLTEAVTKLDPVYLPIYGDEGAMPHTGVMRFSSSDILAGTPCTPARVFPPSGSFQGVMR